MEEFKKKFVDEAFDHINDLEESLLLLEKDPSDGSVIETAFRAMHSLKGGGAMFGFDEISQVTHDLESIYDQIRGGEALVTSDLISLTLNALDFIKEVLNEEVYEENVLSNLLLNIKKYYTSFARKECALENDFKQEASIRSFYVKFEPDIHVLENGTNPLYLIDELVMLGRSFVLAEYSRLPDWDSVDFSACYFSWSIILSGKISESEIKDVFLFVEDECHLEVMKLSDSDVFDVSGFVEGLKETSKNIKQLSLQSVQDLIFDLSNKLSVNDEEKQEVSKVVQKTGKPKTTISSIRVASEKVDLLMNLVSELVTTQARLSLFAEKQDNTELASIAENIQKLSRELRDNAFSIVLIPIESVITRFQRLVRDLSSDLGKEIVFETFGGETELDKTIIENLTDPLMHILRNSLDHGIEMPEARIAAGKSKTGKIVFRAYHSGPNVFIEIEDDGRGIDPEKVREKAIAKKLISPDQIFSERELFDLIFLPGFSTADVVSDISGRGVGMDVVKKKISSIRGEIDVESTIGQGTCIRIKLPLTLSIIDGLLVKISGIFFVFPLSAISKIYSLDNCETNFGNLVVVDGEQIPYFDLQEEFNLDWTETKNKELVVVSSEDKMIGLTVDSVLGEYQAVLKPLGKHYKDQEVISGATILGDGTIALVLDTNKAVKRFSSVVVASEM